MSRHHPGDLVATAAAALQCGADVRLADMAPRPDNFDVASAAALVSPERIVRHQRRRGRQSSVS